MPGNRFNTIKKTRLLAILILTTISDKKTTLTTLNQWIGDSMMRAI